MKNAGLPLNLLQNVATVLTSASHVVRGEPPAAAASLSAAPMPSGGGVPAAAAAGAASAASAGAAGTSQSVSVSEDSDRVLRPKATERDYAGTEFDDEDVAGELKGVSDDELADREFVPNMPSVNDKSREGKRYLYANDLVRQALVKTGLFEGIPATDSLLTGFKTHLMNDLQMKKGDAATAIVTRVARFFYHFQSLCRPTSDPPIAIDVATLSQREHCGSFFANLRSAGVGGAGQKNYITAVRKFLNFLIASSSLPDEDCRQAERLLAAINMVKIGVQSAVNKDQGDNNLRHIMYPTENTCQLKLVMQAVTSEAISTDVHNAIARAKAISEKRRGGDFIKISGKEHRLVTRYLGGAVIQLAHCQRPGAKTIKKNTNSTQNKSETHHAKQYEVTSFLSTDCELSTETCSKNVYSLGPWSMFINDP